jgi:hypothetical protein
MKLELKLLETNDSSVASIWKKKCLDLFEVCQTMKSENEELRARCKELIEQGINLADAVATVESYESQTTQNYAKMPLSAGLGSMATRPMVSTANTFNNYPQATGTRTYIGSAGVTSGGKFGSELGLPADKTI